MKRKIKDGTPPFAVRLPQDLQERLRRAGGERGMGEEIRRRLEASFDAEKTPKNPKTKALLDAIAFVADETDDNYGPWSENAFAFDVLKACVDLLLVLDRPKGEAIAPADTIASLIYGDDPKEISRILVGDVARSRRRAIARDEKR
jgi:hypothetical protein